MSQSFFHLIPRQEDGHGPHICADCADALAEEPQEETRANMKAAIALGEALLDAVDAYTDAHPETTYRHCFEALAYMSWQFRREQDEEAADA